jgi:hypothetical protein
MLSYFELPKRDKAPKFGQNKKIKKIQGPYRTRKNILSHLFVKRSKYKQKRDKVI